MDVSTIDRVLAEANPWWRDPDWANRDVQLLRAAKAPFTYAPDVLADLARGGLYLLRGPRRVGKSTELKRAIANILADGVPPRSVVYLSIEGWRAADLEQLIAHSAEAVSGRPGEGYWFLDEITGVDGPWPSVIKRMRDSNIQFAEDTVVLSGSSAAQLDESTKALAGRRGRATRSDRVMLQMPFVDVADALGYSMPESPELNAEDLAAAGIADLTGTYRPWLTQLVDAWERYLTVGGYPQAVADHVNRGLVETSFSDTLFDVVHGDALSRARLSPVQTTGLLRTVARSVSSTLEVSTAATNSDTAQQTAKERLDDLRRSFLAFPVYREQGLAPKPRSQAKWYFTDPQLASLAAQRGAGAPPNQSALSEQQIALALLRSLEATNPHAAVRHDQLLYYRSGTAAEIDFVSAALNGVCVESKYVDRSWGRAFQTIESSPYQIGIVATRSGLKQHDGGWAMPAGLLAFLLGA